MKFSQLTTGVALLAFAGSASALPTLGDILGSSAYDSVVDTGAEYVKLSDGNMNADSATAFMLLENAGYRTENTFGIYEFGVDDLGVVTLGDTLEVFDGAACSFLSDGFGCSDIFSSSTIEFDLTLGTAYIEGSEYDPNSTDYDAALIPNYIDETFGFYLTNPNGETYYTHSYLNNHDSDTNFDMALIFDVSGMNSLFGSEIIVAWDDEPDLHGNNGEPDFNDMVVGLNDVAVVPEPSVIALFGLGLMGMGLVARRRKQI